MKMKIFGVTFLMFGLCMSFVSAGLFDDVFHGITGNVISEVKEGSFGEKELGNISCEQVKEVFSRDFPDYEIPKAIPFKNEIFDVYIDDEFFVSAELVDKRISQIVCEPSDEVTYNVYIKSKLILDAMGNKEEIKPIDFYNENRKNGQLKIKPVGIIRKIKMGLINFGLKIASWFS